MDYEQIASVRSIAPGLAQRFMREADVEDRTDRDFIGGSEVHRERARLLRLATAAILSAA
jgi:hypothetical protein